VAILRTASLQAIHIHDQELTKHLKHQFIEAVKVLAAPTPLAKRSGGATLLTSEDGVDGILLALFDTALNLSATGETGVGGAFSELSDTLVQTANAWPDLIPQLRPIVSTSAKNYQGRRPDICGDFSSA